MIKIKNLYINDFDYAKYTTTPVQVQETIDGSLDLLYVELKNVFNDYNELYSYPFKPFSNARVVIEDGESEKTLYMIIESDTVEEVIKNKSYNHKLMLIEETKNAERYFVDKSINQPVLEENLGTAKFKENKQKAIIKRRTYDYNEEYQLEGVFTNYFGDVKLPDFDDFPGQSWSGAQDHYIYFKDSQGNNISWSFGKDGDKSFVKPDNNLTENETYTITYYGLYNTGSSAFLYEDTFSFMYTSKNIASGKYIKKNTDNGATTLFEENLILNKDIVKYCNSKTVFPNMNTFIPSLTFFKDFEISVESDRGEKFILDKQANETFTIDIPLYYGRKYYINYMWYSSVDKFIGRNDYRFYFIWIDEENNPLRTVKKVVSDLFITTETLRENETPKFSIADIGEYNESDKYKEMVSDIYNSICPEFSFGKLSLIEALRMIGDKYGFEPRFRNNKLFLDLVGINEKQELKDIYFSNIQSQSSNEFCNKLDSFVSNLVNNIDVNEGAVRDPMPFVYKTIRTDYGETHITTDNMIFATQYPIEKPIKLEIGFVYSTTGVGFEIGDITEFLYEENEYNLLPSLEDIYPGSKKYALKYKRGEKNITGLHYKLEKPTSAQDFFEQYSIQEIIKKKMGGVPLMSNIFEIQYRFTYIPIIDARITQVREDIKGTDNIVSLAYNQSATKVESQSFGGNLKTNVNKLGNIEKTKMYLMPRLSMLPVLGKNVDDNYVITTIKTEYYPKFIKCEVGFTKNYTKKNEYIGVNSNLDLFEYDRRNTIDRHVIYEDYCIITEGTVWGGNTSLITEDGALEFSGSFCGKSYFNGVDVGMVKATTFDNFDNKLMAVAMPVISLGFGNSMAFMFEYVDTITADSSVKTTTGNFREQYYNKYTDTYGEFEKLKIEFGTPKQSPGNYTTSVKIGNNLPQESAIKGLEPLVFFSTDNNNIIIKKDVGERICFTYQIHFVCDDDYVVGSAFASRNNLVSGSGSFEYVMYFLNDKLDKLQDKVIITNADKSIKFEEENIGYWNGGTEFKNIIAPDGEFKAWAIVDIKDGKNDLIFGKNVDIKGGEKVKMPSLYFKHKLED